MEWRGDPLQRLEALFCRAVRDIYSPLDASGSMMVGGRFNPRDIAALYLAPNPDLALRESVGSADWADYRAFAPRKIVCVRAALSRVVDLTPPGAAASVGVSADDLVGDWTALDSPTQAIGQQAFIDGVEAILFPSRIDPSQHNLAVFRDNLLATSELRVVEADGG